MSFLFSVNFFSGTTLALREMTFVPLGSFTVIHGFRHSWQGVTKVANSTDVNRTVRFSDRLQRGRTGCNRDRPDDQPSLAACAIHALLA